jgi:hypothetical protein
MSNRASIPRVAVQILFVSLFLVVLTGCGHGKGHGNGSSEGCRLAGGEMPDDPADCTLFAVNVTVANNPPGCIVNPGVSRKCSSNNLACPFNNGPKLCKTKVLDAAGNCGCRCP